MAEIDIQSQFISIVCVCTVNSKTIQARKLYFVFDFDLALNIMILWTYYLISDNW